VAAVDSGEVFDDLDVRDDGGQAAEEEESDGGSLAVADLEDEFGQGLDVRDRRPVVEVARVGLQETARGDQLHDPPVKIQAVFPRW